MQPFKDNIAKTVEDLIRSKSMSGNGHAKPKVVDIVKDVINLVPVYFAATQLVRVHLYHRRKID
jgi:hypothetical protein